MERNKYRPVGGVIAEFSVVELFLHDPNIQGDSSIYSIMDQYLVVFCKHKKVEAFRVMVSNHLSSRLMDPSTPEDIVRYIVLECGLAVCRDAVYANICAMDGGVGHDEMKMHEAQDTMVRLSRIKSDPILLIKAIQSEIEKYESDIQGRNFVRPLEGDSKHPSMADMPDWRGLYLGSGDQSNDRQGG